MRAAGSGNVKPVEMQARRVDLDYRTRSVLTSSPQFSRGLKVRRRSHAAKKIEERKAKKAVQAEYIGVNKSVKSASIYCFTAPFHPLSAHFNPLPTINVVVYFSESFTGIGGKKVF